MNQDSPIMATIALCSPAGTTRAAGKMIAETLRSLGMAATEFSICGDDGREAALRAFGEISWQVPLLFVGSPVYGFHPLPPVMDFIHQLPPLNGVYAVPFVAWGGVCSGSALFEMGTELLKKGAALAGALSIPSEHSMSWAFSKPVCGGRPNRKDKEQIGAAVRAVYQKATEGNASFLSPLEISRYTGDSLATMLEGGFEKSKARFPKIEINMALCVACGRCMEVCPVECITLNPAPILGDACIRCYNCVRACPEEALTADFSKSEEIIMSRIEKLKEPQETVTCL